MTYTAAQRAAYSRKIRNYTKTDPRWALRSKAFRDQHGHWCDACRRPGPCDAHHVTYDRAFSGTEPDSDLRSLDRRCHEAVHQLARSGMPLVRATDLVIRHRGPVGMPKRNALQAVMVWATVMAILLGIAAMAVILSR